MNRGYPRQKQLTGRTPETYEWVDRKPVALRGANRAVVPEVLEVEVYGRSDRQLKQCHSLLSTALMYSTVIFVVLVLFMEIGKLSEISSQSKLINSLKMYNQILTAEVENLEIEYGMERRSTIIKQNATEILDMIEPEAKDVLLLDNVKRATGDATQTAEGIARGR